MTKAQRKWIDLIGKAGEVKVADIPRETRQALVRHGMIVDAYVGVRKRMDIVSHYKLSALGQMTREEQTL